MESSKRKRFSKDNHVDRISMLPNVLLHQILSFLDTLQVVQTCVLSRRWMDLWKSHPYLHFNYRTFSSILQLDSEDSEDDFIRTQQLDHRDKFHDFINQVLVRRKNFKVVKLCLDSCGLSKRGRALIESLVYYAVKHQVEEIFIHHCFLLRSIMLPHCFSNCESLRSLTLKVNQGQIDLPKSLGLPCLKTLHLDGAHFDGKILSSCPNLEYLTIGRIQLEGIDNFNIHALKLKRLEILTWEYDGIMDGCKVMIFAPKLTYFEFEGNAPLLLSEVNLTSLDDVKVNLWEEYPNSYISDEDDIEQLSLILINMLNEFKNAKSLTLSVNIIEVLSKAPAALNEHHSPFVNLKYLKLQSDSKDVTLSAHVLNYFLRSSSSLKICF